MAPLRGIVLGQTLDKGLGLFATQAMQGGTRVLIEPPLFMKGQNFNDSLLALSPTKRAIYQQLYSQLGASNENLSIYEMNSWPCPDLGEPVIFALTSCINHSCHPNAIQFYNHVLGKNTWDVVENEEITICYIEPSIAQNARRRALQRRWGFTCTCIVCQKQSPKREKSDWQRERIATLRRCLLLGTVPDAEPHMDPAFMSIELIHLVGEEGIMNYYGLAYRTIKEEKAAAGLADETKEWTLSEQQVDLLLHGLDFDNEHVGKGAKREADEISAE